MNRSLTSVLIKKLEEAEKVINYYANPDNWSVLEDASGTLYGGVVVDEDIEPESVDFEYGAGGRLARNYFKVKANR